MKHSNWELRDVVFLSILGVVFAAVYLAVFQGGLLLSTVLSPLGLSAFGFEVVYGIWFMAATLSAYIIQKPGAALLAEVLASAIELLMGNSGGVTVVLTGLIQGAGVEVIFFLFRYRRWDLLTMSLSAITAAALIFCYELYYLNYIALAPTLLAAQLAVRFLSAVLFSGIICKRAADALAKTGVLKSYALGRRVQAAPITEEEDASWNA